MKSRVYILILVLSLPQMAMAIANILAGTGHERGTQDCRSAYKSIYEQDREKSRQKDLSLQQSYEHNIEVAKQRIAEFEELIEIEQVEIASMFKDSKMTKFINNYSSDLSHGAEICGSEDTGGRPPDGGEDCVRADPEFCKKCNKIVANARDEFDSTGFCKSRNLKGNTTERECNKTLKMLNELQEDLAVYDKDLESFKSKVSDIEDNIRKKDRARLRTETEGGYVPICTKGCGERKTFDWLKLGVSIIGGITAYRSAKYVSDTNAKLSRPTNVSPLALGAGFAAYGYYGGVPSGGERGTIGCANTYSNSERIQRSLFGIASLAGGVDFPGQNSGAFGYPQDFYREPTSGGLFNSSFDVQRREGDRPFNVGSSNSAALCFQPPCDNTQGFRTGGRDQDLNNLLIQRELDALMERASGGSNANTNVRTNTANNNSNNNGSFVGGSDRGGEANYVPAGRRPSGSSGTPSSRGLGTPIER